jgi:hypothetical protein
VDGHRCEWWREGQPDLWLNSVDPVVEIGGLQTLGNRGVCGATTTTATADAVVVAVLLLAGQLRMLLLRTLLLLLLS